jgi:hypothetical protein
LAVDTASLYRGPLADFVARRTALVRELQPTDPDAAAAAGKLRKPAASAWAIDQLAADNAPLIAELLAVGADARDAQWSLAAGSVSREDLQVASGRLRDAVDAAARAAVAHLERDGHGTSDETSRRIRTTLQAAATGSAADRQALWAGTLSADLDVAGFGSIQEPEPDAPEIAAVVGPLRRATSPRPSSPPEDRTSKTVDNVARRAAERSAANLVAAAERAREAAVTARREADRLTEEARVAVERASVAEGVADVAETSARTARAALKD